MARKKMNPEIKEQWLKALRSGRYEQVEGKLRGQTNYGSENKKYGYCCLGVLCNISGEGRWGKNYPDHYLVKGVKESALEEFEPEDLSNQTDLILGDGGMLTKPMLQKAGITPKTQTFLANMNDHGGTFEEIADWIEKNL